mgnify:CR=1 FL=1
MKQRCFTQKGSILFLTMIFLVVLVILATTFLNKVMYNNTNGTAQTNSLQAFYIAEAGIEKAIYYLRNTAPDTTTNGSWRTSVYPTASGVNPTDPQQQSLGGGSYTIWVETTANTKIKITSAGTYNGLTRIVRENLIQSGLSPEDGSWAELSAV